MHSYSAAILTYICIAPFYLLQGPPETLDIFLFFPLDSNFCYKNVALFLWRKKISCAFDREFRRGQASRGPTINMLLGLFSHLALFTTYNISSDF